MLAQIRAACSAAAQRNTRWLLAKYRAQGAQMLTYGGDFALAQVLADCRRDFDQAFGE